ncbi:MAG: hypothetical protein ACTHW1_10535, partial [Ancrocorticia sp.]
MMNTTKKTGIAALIMAGALGLGACSAGSAPDQDSLPQVESLAPGSETTAAPAPETEAPTLAPTDEDAPKQTPTANPKPQDSSNPDAADPGSAVSDAMSESSAAGDVRKALAPQATQQLQCNGGDIDIKESGAIIEITDDCDELDIDAHGAIVIAQNVNDVSIDGQGNVLVVKSAREIDLDDDAHGNIVIFETGNP